MLLAGVNNEHAAGQFLHFFDTAEVLHELFTKSAELNDFLLGEKIEIAVRFHFVDLVELCNTGLDGLEVGEKTAEPTLVDIEHFAALCFLFDALLSLLLGADKKNGAVVHRNIANEIVGFVNLFYGFLKVDDVDTVALGEDVFLHLRIPTAGLVTEMYACFQKLLHRNN